MNAEAANTLLWVVPADEAHPPGNVERLLPGLLKGHIDRFAPGDDAHTLSLHVWLELCRNAYSLSGGAPCGILSSPVDGAPAAPAIVDKAASPRRSVVFIGNCQLLVLSELYRSSLPKEHAEEVAYVASYLDADDARKQAVANADVLVQQMLDFKPRIGDLPARGIVYHVPHVTAAFLWPYTGQAHPRNTSEPHLDESGPYPAELGDSFLNRMIADSISEVEAVRRYQDTDVAKAKNVDRLMELLLEKQRIRDKACGFAFADYIATRFRQECLFRTPNHPERGMTLKMAVDLFSQMGVGAEAIARMLAEAPESLFPTSETPVHPSVAAHFGVAYAPSDRRYRYFDEGKFSFDEYASRYMRYEWNGSLAEGLYLLRIRQTELGVSKLTAALQTAPRTAAGRIALARALEQLGRIEEATEYAGQAAAIEPRPTSVE